MEFLKIWNKKKGKCIKKIKVHKYSINSLFITSNNKYIISGSDDETIKIFNIENNIEKIKDNNKEKFIDGGNKEKIKYNNNIQKIIDNNNIKKIIDNNNIQKIKYKNVDKNIQ